MSEIAYYSGLHHPSAASTFAFATNSQITLSATTSRVNIPLRLRKDTEIDLLKVYLASGASTAFRARIVTVAATTGEATDTLAHANASATITAASANWNTFDFTNFTLSAGNYWISLDSTDTPATALAIQYNSDYDGFANNDSSAGVRYWTGSALANTAAIVRCIRLALKSTTGWVPVFPCAPLGAASGIDSLIMDTLENPACRGVAFIAPVSGKICGWNINKAAITANTSFDFVMATSGCASELARVEEFATPAASTAFIHRVRFPDVDVVAGSRYDVYITAGSQATTTGGISITALDTSEDSGNVIGSYGVTPGDLKGLYVHEPPTEGGSDVPTTTLNHVFPWVPVYSQITTSGGGGGETAHVFAA